MHSPIHRLVGSPDRGLEGSQCQLDSSEGPFTPAAPSSNLKYCQEGPGEAALCGTQGRRQSKTDFNKVPWWASGKTRAQRVRLWIRTCQGRKGGWSLSSSPNLESGSSNNRFLQACPYIQLASKPTMWYLHSKLCAMETQPCVPSDSSQSS
jgi:hypothetical protein